MLGEGLDLKKQISAIEFWKVVSPRSNLHPAADEAIRIVKMKLGLAMPEEEAVCQLESWAVDTASVTSASSDSSATSTNSIQSASAPAASRAADETVRQLESWAAEFPLRAAPLVQVDVSRVGV